MAWADREWTLDGAAVRISMIGFDDAWQNQKALNGLLNGLTSGFNLCESNRYMLT